MKPELLVVIPNMIIALVCLYQSEESGKRLYGGGVLVPAGMALAIGGYWVGIVLVTIGVFMVRG